MTTRDDRPTPTGPTGPEASPGFLLWRTTLRWQRDITAALRPLELTHVQFVLLATVWWLSGHAAGGVPLPTQRQVADQAEVDVMMTSQVLRTLAARGLVERAHDAQDRRVRRVVVTGPGRRLAERAIVVVEDVDAAFFSRATDRGRLLEVLHQLSDGADHGTGPPTRT